MSILTNLDSRRLDQRVTFQSKTYAQSSGSGAMDPVWTDYCTVWAAVDGMLANKRDFGEEIRGGQELSAGRYTVWIRWRSDLNTNMRMVWNGQNFDVVGIPNNQRRGRYISVYVATGVNEG